MTLLAAAWSSHPHASNLGWLADEAGESTTGDIGPGLLAFLVVAALAIATFLLIRSMLTHIKRVPPSFETPETNDDPHEPTDTK